MVMNKVELQFPISSQVPAFGAEVYSPGMQVRGTGEATQRTGAPPAKTVSLEADGKNSISGEVGKREGGRRGGGEEGRRGGWGRGRRGGGSRE